MKASDGGARHVQDAGHTMVFTEDKKSWQIRLGTVLSHAVE